MIATTSAGVGGNYPFNVVATDGTVTSRASTTLKIGDFGIIITPSTQAAPATGNAAYNLTVNPINNFLGQLDVSVSGPPSGASATSAIGTVGASPSPMTLNIATNNVAGGSYLFTVSGTSGSLTRSESATLVVKGTATPPGFTGSITPTSATVSVGQSGNFAIRLNSQNGATGAVNLQCVNVPNGTTCAFSPTAPTLPANGSVSDTLTVQVNSMPAGSSPRSPASRPYPPDRFGPFWLFVITLAAGAALTVKMWGRRRRLAASAAVLLGIGFLLLAMASCGGGGGSAPSPSPPSSVVMTITVQANGAGVSAMQTIGTLAITVN